MVALRKALVLLCAVLTAACSHVGPTPRDAPLELRAMTYNIRLDIASDGDNAWPNRAALVADVIRHEAPAVLGMQEVLLNQRLDLERALPGYAFVGAGRDDGAQGGEASPVGWDRARFELLESDTFWLSPTPEQPGKAWDAAYPRVATWVLLRERKSGRRLRVLNTHFDHVGTEARARSAAQIAEWTKKRIAAGEAVVVLGDFNATSDTLPIVALADPSRSGLRLARTASATPPYGPPGTFNAFKIDSSATEPIDHVFVSPGFGVLHYSVVTQHWAGRLPSDHYPVVVDLVLRP